MFQNASNQAQYFEPEKKERLGVFAARIGMQHAHRIGVSIPVAPPERHSATVGAIGMGARTSIAKVKRSFEYSEAGYPTRALPGATVYLEVQDISRLEPALVEKVKWVCTHPDCAGQKHDSPQALVQSHPDEVRLRQQSTTETVYGSAVKGRPHMYFGVLEIAAQPDKKDDKGNVKPGTATEATVMLLSGEM